jgi:hypothetical protein
VSELLGHHVLVGLARPHAQDGGRKFLQTTCTRQLLSVGKRFPRLTSIDVSVRLRQRLAGPSGSGFRIARRRSLYRRRNDDIHP